MRQPIIPPVRMSAGLWTPRYIRLNMIRNDQRATATNSIVEREEGMEVP